MDPYINLARKAIGKFINQGKVLEIAANLPTEILKKRAAVFVTLHEKSTGQLRGCVGTFIPTCKNIASEIIQNAISSATSDPRFPPLSRAELEDLDIKVDVLSKPVSSNSDQLNPKKYGLIIKSRDRKTGLLLPNIPSVTTCEQQIKICKQKACIGSNEPVQLFRFTVERHKE